VSQDIDTDVSRRNVVVLGAGLVVGTGALAACSGSSSTASTVASAPAPASSAAPAASAAAAPAASSGGGSAGGGAALAKLSDVPVGGAFAAKDAAGKPIIIAQPTAGKVVAFTAICTHMGCTVAPATGTALACPCHGSTYDGTTGANTGGPAKRPLTAVPVAISGDSIVAG